MNPSIEKSLLAKYGAALEEVRPFKVRKYTYTFFVPNDNLEPEQTIEKDLIDIKNQHLKVDDLMELANDPDSGIYCEVDIQDM